MQPRLVSEPNKVRFADRHLTMEHPIIPKSERTRRQLRELTEGKLGSADGRPDLERLAARLSVEEALETEARNVAPAIRARTCRAVRMTNLLDQLFEDERQCITGIPHTFGASAALKLTYAAFVRAAELICLIPQLKYSH